MRSLRHLGTKAAKILDRARQDVRLSRDDLVSPDVCAAAGRHGDAKDSPFVGCEHCGTFRWNGVDMCGKLIRSPLMMFDRLKGGRQVAHACTRALNHGGGCAFRRLPRDNPKSYTPS